MHKPLERILYVEDDPDIQTIALMVLESISGFQVLACSSGAEAISRGGDYAPDLVLLDVMMPGMDGPETLRALRQLPHLAHTPIVFMTAKVQPQEVQEYLNLGAAGVIAKPFDPMSLSQQLLDIWARQPAAQG